MHGQNRMLLLASYIFYGWWDIRSLIWSCCRLAWISVRADPGAGRNPARDRFRVSVFLILAALAFVTFRWDGFRAAGPLCRARRSSRQCSALGLPVVLPALDWSRLVSPDWLGWTVLGGTVGVVLVANLVYYPLSNLSEDRRRRVGLVLTVSCNLTFLGFFNISIFLLIADRLLASLGYSAESFHLHIVLPAGISFYTFHSLSYTIDVYKKRTEAVRSLEDYAFSSCFSRSWWPDPSSAPAT